MKTSKFTVNNLQFNYSGDSDEVSNINVFFNCRILDNQIETGHFDGQVLLTPEEVKSFAVGDLAKAVIENISRNVLTAA
ncbi:MULTISPECIES: hypothetical protein [Enterococcus]|uniref:hypothetical protein n=1 Tax=Enterococcus TaxID=1350 RepID=UPI000A3669A4|nr:hypothetical protein [Enterococcus sp. 4E1_DIV0656]OTO09305.1 hypothetical protein A5882_003638 [Enterococcus sp. 4E1_DIV0656]